MQLERRVWDSEVLKDNCVCPLSPFRSAWLHSLNNFVPTSSTTNNTPYCCYRSLCSISCCHVLESEHFHTVGTLLDSGCRENR